MINSVIARGGEDGQAEHKRHFGKKKELSATTVYLLGKLSTKDGGSANRKCRAIVGCEESIG
jgi:hypothetical protein